jgi:S-formylglutathione hydrolase FrmB
MPMHPFDLPRGRIEHPVIESAALAENLLGDPGRRAVAVYLPPGYDDTDERYPLFVDLAGFTGSGLKRLAWQAFGESVPQRVDRLVASGAMGPVVMAFPDGFTSLGGNQYVDSPATGRWETFVAGELIDALERRYRIAPGRRAVLGKSSGGYGALVQALRHGERWAAAAAHSPDVGFDVLLRRDLPLLADALAAVDGSPAAFVERLRGAPKIVPRDMHVLMLLAMAASYDPDPTAPYGIRLPLDVRTCELDPARWERWLAHDPLVLVDRPECRRSLARLRGFFVDCGSRDEYFSHYGARAFVRKLGAAGIAHRYEEFDDGHTGTDYRLDVSLPFLYRAVMGA